MIHQKNFYPRSPCGERPEGASARIRPVIISIHALLAESDNVVLALQLSVTDFYPRSPCGERRIQAQRAVLVAAISIHALLAESDGLLTHSGHPLYISIHALLAESDYPSAACRPRGADFYPRSPCGERLSAVFLLLAAGVFLSTLSLRRATTSNFKYPEPS